jgi:ATP-dependent helicase YprA (DUF1998 family)
MARRWQVEEPGQVGPPVEQPEDPELFLRHKVQEHVPDLLVTNYSMLEYHAPAADRTRHFPRTAGATLPTQTSA